jgi:ABC-type dipeptide/oligopeptide/nickel transport system permease subunit
VAVVVNAIDEQLNGSIQVGVDYSRAPILPLEALLSAAEGAEQMGVFPWTLVFPALMLALALFCFNFLGDGLRDALDPKVRRD